MSDRKARYGYDPTPEVTRNYERRATNADQAAVERAARLDTARQMHAILSAQPGMLASSLPNITRATGDRDLTSHIASMTAEMQRRGIPNPTRNPLPQPARTTGNAPVDAGGSPIVPRPAGAAPAPMNPADLKLWRENYQGPNPPKAPLPPDYHTDLRDSPEHGTINPIPGQPLRAMPMSGPTNWNYPKEAAPVATAAAAPVPFQSGTVLDRETAYDPRTDTTPVGASLNAARQAAAANPGKTAMAAVPGGIAGVSFMKPADTLWHQGIMDKYPEIGKAGSPDNKAFTDRYKVAKSWSDEDPKNRPIDPMAIADSVYTDRQAKLNAPSTPTPQTARDDTPSSRQNDSVPPTPGQIAGGIFSTSMDPVVQGVGAVVNGVKNLYPSGAVPNVGAPYLDVIQGAVRGVKSMFSPSPTPPAPFTPAAPAATPSDVPPTPLGSTSMNEDPTKQFAQNTEDAEFKKKLTTSPPNVFAYT